MKKVHVFLMLVMAVAIAVIITTMREASVYVDFQEAALRAERGDHALLHVIGTLQRDAQGKPVDVREAANHMSFTFPLKDSKGYVQGVFYDEPMPADFLYSEQVLVIGRYEDKQFKADQILMKCPSKYEQQALVTP